MKHFSIPITRLIHENISVIMNFVFSKGPLEQLVGKSFQGEWKYLRKALFNLSEERAEKACLELALFMRMLDDDADISGIYERSGEHDFGRLVIKDKPDKDLSLREVSNKIIHASKLEWDFSWQAEPRLICQTREPKKWIRTEVDIIAVAAACGQIMS